MPGGLHPHAHAEASRLQLSVELLGFSITVVQWSFTALTSLFHKKCNRLKARVVIYAYNHHVRLLSPEPAVVKKPQFTRVKQPTSLCNHVPFCSGVISETGLVPRRLILAAILRTPRVRVTRVQFEAGLVISMAQMAAGRMYMDARKFPASSQASGVRNQ